MSCAADGAPAVKKASLLERLELAAADNLASAELDALLLDLAGELRDQLRGAPTGAAPSGLCGSRRPRRVPAYPCDNNAGHRGHHWHHTGSKLHSWENREAVVLAAHEASLAGFALRFLANFQSSDAAQVARDLAQVVEGGGADSNGA